MRIFILAFLLLIAPIAPAQFADSPEKRVPDPVGRFRYIREYNRAIQTLVKRDKCEDACRKDIKRFGVGIAYMTEFSDDKVTERIQTWNYLLKDAKEINKAR